jgi:putative ABC transport system substrate-binding protein
VDRRRFIHTLTGGLLAVPLIAEAQRPGKVYRIGFLGAASPSGYAPLVEALRLGLRDVGYVEGKNLAIEYRWAEGKYDRLPDLAAELVRQKVDLIVTHGTPGTLAAKQATRTIPIVMALSGDAVANGLVASFPRPGGNITGTSFFFPELNAKRLQLLKAARPPDGGLREPGQSRHRRRPQSDGPDGRVADSGLPRGRGPRTR